MQRPLFLLLAALLGLVLFAAPATAQTAEGRQGDPADRLDRRIEALDEHLDLTDAQEAQLRRHFADQDAAFQAWRKAHPDATREERKAFMKTRHEASQEALSTVLTPEQAAQAKEMKRERPRRQRGELGRRGPEARRARALVSDRVSLSDAQREQLETAHEAQREAFRTWREAHPAATREDRQAFMKARQEAMQATMGRILTPEQTARLEEMKSRSPRSKRADKGQRAAPGEKALRGIDVTDAQREQLQALRETQRDEARAWRDANPEATPDARRAFMRQQRDEARSTLESVLTPDQRQALEKRAERRPRARRAPGDHTRREGRKGRADASAAPAPADDAGTAAFALANYPNPFNPTTEIRFDLPAAGHVTLTVFDAQGREVQRLVDRRLDAGNHRVAFDAADLPSGIYLYRLTTGGLTETGRMTLLK